MPRVAVLPIVAVAVVLALVLVAQLLLPVIAEHKVEDRLTRGGGSASAEVSAFPALRLLAGDGDSLTVRGRGLRLEPRAADEFGRLDGFDASHVSISDSRVGPVAIRSLELRRRDGERDYRMRIAGAATPRAMASFLGSRAAGGLGGVLGDLAGGSLPGGDVAVPFRLSGRVESDGGRPVVSGLSGSVAGLPAGALAQIAVDAVLRSL